MLTNIVEELDNRAYEYMSQWRDHEGWSDLNAFLDEGDIYLAANLLVEAGAIDSHNCYQEFKETEIYIESLAKRFRRMSKKKQKNHFDEALKNYLTYSCESCNHVSFVEKYNARLYEKDLKKCWSCGSGEIKKEGWSEK
jgi:hypothetical protein